MHPRSIYSQPINFEELAKAYPPLLEFLIPTNAPTHWKTIDFHNEHAQRCLTQALLHRDFSLQLSLPEDRLCPAVPNRVNYVLWIQDIMRAHLFLFKEDNRTIRGIDIGTGASAIYPLLACKMEPEWEFVATEIDEKSYAYAERNIQINQMEHRIQLLRANPNGSILFPLSDFSHSAFDFVMCNPPFYSSREEIAKATESKELPPNAVCTGADIEMIYPPGGEVAFVAKMIDESARYRARCRWFTTMLGKLATLYEIVELLRKRSAFSYAITEFTQGQTRRWGIAWSFTHEHLPDSMARITSLPPSNSLYSLLPPRNTLENRFLLSFASIDASFLQSTLLEICSVVSASERPLIILHDDHSPDSPLKLFRLNPILVQASSNVWSRKERRKQRFAGRADAPAVPSSVVPLMCSLQWLMDLSTSPAVIILQSQWVYGDDRNIFESFVGYVNRKLSQALEPYSLKHRTSKERIMTNDPPC